MISPDQAAKGGTILLRSRITLAAYKGPNKLVVASKRAPGLSNNTGSCQCSKAQHGTAGSAEV